MAVIRMRTLEGGSLIVTKHLACLLAGAAWLAAAAPADSAADGRPNIIFILADDYGIPGVGCCGGSFKTPHLDALAAGGVRFERCFAAPLCAPSRALCKFGRYAFRTGVLDNGCGGAAKPNKEISIAKTLKAAGCACAAQDKPNIVVLLSDDAGYHEFNIPPVYSEENGRPHQPTPWDNGRKKGGGTGIGEE
jgi:hypothetical protein